MPPHPAGFIRNDCYEKHGYFNIKYKIASDYDLLLRFLKLNNLISLIVIMVIKMIMMNKELYRI